MKTTIEVGVGEWQSKLATALREDTQALVDALLFSKRRHDTSFSALARAVNVAKALQETCQLTVTCMSEHTNREDFSKAVFGKLRG